MRLAEIIADLKMQCNMLNLSEYISKNAIENRN